MCAIVVQKSSAMAFKNKKTQIMNLSELLHKRILIATKERSYGEQTVSEFLILEISPSQNWIKVQDMNGRKYWKHSSTVTPIEVLLVLEKSPK